MSAFRSSWLLVGLLLAACTLIEPQQQVQEDRPTATFPTPEDVVEQTPPQQAEASLPAQDTTVLIPEETSSLPALESLSPILPDPLEPQISLEAQSDDEQIQQQEPEEQGLDDALTLDTTPMMERLCREIGGKLGSVSVEDCHAQDLKYDGHFSVNNRPLAIRDFMPGEGDFSARVLMLGGIHGDEYSSISILFKWMEILSRADTEFYWRVLPSANPDGLLDGAAIRQNANGVDLNRNFPTRDWPDMAHKNWVENTGRNQRRFPGTGPASEPEVQWLVRQIEIFKPDVIVSVHAPYHLLDYDGPSEAPEKIGELYLHQLGVYPGSLGNYGGVDLGIPVITLELPSAGIMPNNEQISTMWLDLVSWLKTKSMQLSTR